MSYSLAANKIEFKRNRNLIRHQSAQQGLGPVASTMLLFMIIGVLGLLYLTQVTKTSSFSYQLNDLEEKRAYLVQKNQSLKVEAARLRSIDTIQKSQVARNLTNTSGEVSYAR